MSDKYKKKASELASVIKIAMESFIQYPPTDMGSSDVQKMLDFYKDIEIRILNPNPKYLNLKSLAYLESDIFTYFNEASSECVNKFWGKINNENLPFKRQNKIFDIIERGFIKSNSELNFVIDIINPYFQKGVIDINQKVLLDRMIINYQSK